MPGPDHPVLAQGTRISRQVEKGVVRFVVRAGTTGKYLRVGEAEEKLLSLMDGNRTLAEIRKSWMAATRKPIAVRDIAGFLAQMRRSGVVDPTAEARNLLLVEKVRQRRKEKLFSVGKGTLFFYRFKLIDPDRVLTVLERYLRWIFTSWFLAFAALLVLSAASVLVLRREEVFSRLKDFSLIGAGAGTGFAAIWFTALGIVAIHETAHGVACKHWGGEVHEMGFLLLFFNPCLYCNVNDAWTFESRAAQLWTTAAGGFIEVVLGSACVLVWAATEPGTVVHSFTYLVFMISLSSTLLFNMNPLIKLDGYYLAADLLKVENLRERSYKHLGWLFRSKLLRRPASPVAADAREAWILGTYAVASSAYMALIVIALLRVLSGTLGGEAGAGTIQVVLFAWIVWLILKRPLSVLGGAVMDIAKEKPPTGKFWAGCAAAGAGAVLLALWIPCTRASSGTGRVEPWKTMEVRSPVDGTIAEVLAGEGSAVEAGAPLFRVAAPVEEATARVERANSVRARRASHRLRAEGNVAGAESMAKEAEASELKAADAEDRVARSVVASPLSGMVLTPRALELQGMPVRRETPVMEVGDFSRFRFRTLMNARDVGPVREGMEARVHLQARPGEPLPGKVVAVARQSADPAEKGAAEGRAAEVAAAAGPRWEVIVEVENPGLAVLPGMSGDVSVVYERTSLAGALVKGIRDSLRSDLLR